MKRLKWLMVEAMRRHLDTGKPPVVPLAGVPLWAVFAAISPGRGWNDTGPQPLGAYEIREQGALMGLPLDLRCVDLIRALDGCWLESARAAPVKASLRELTPELFDAMLG